MNVPDGILKQPQFNIAPTQNVLALTNRDSLSVTELRWALAPCWAADPAAMKLTTFNARTETIAGTVTATAGTKTPIWISRRDNWPFVFAGLWDTWRRDGAVLRSSTIVMQPPNELLAPIHSRMAVVLHDDAVSAWLSPGDCEAGEMLALLVPQSPDDWDAYPALRAFRNRAGGSKRRFSSLLTRLRT